MEYYIRYGEYVFSFRGEWFRQFGEVDQYNQYDDLEELSVPCLHFTPGPVSAAV